MASRYTSLSKPAISLLRSAATTKPRPSSPSLFNTRSSATTALSRPIPQLGCLQSMLPLYSAVSSARLTSCLGLDSSSSRSLSQGMISGANPGV